MLPFDQADFFGVFADYNRAIWPAQLVAYAAGWLAVLLALRPVDVSHRLVWSIVATMWAWTGLVYHATYFAEINPIARVFGAAFVIQAALFAWFGVARPDLKFGPVKPHRTFLAWGAILYATVFYPALGALAGHAYPAAPSFGVTPCPLVIFTFGLLLLARGPVPRLVLAIPVAWALIGGVAAAFLGVPEDWMLPASAVLTVVALGAWRRPQPATGASRTAAV